MNGRSAAAAVPPFRPLMSAAANLVRNVRLSAQQQPAPQQPPLKPLPVPAFAALPESIAKVAVETPSPPPSVVAVHRRQPPATVVMPVAVVGRVPHVQPQTPVQPVVVQAPALVQAPGLVQATPLNQRPQTSAAHQHDAMQQAANRRFNVSTKRL